MDNEDAEIEHRQSAVPLTPLGKSSKPPIDPQKGVSCSTSKNDDDNDDDDDGKDELVKDVKKSNKGEAKKKPNEESSDSEDRMRDDESEDEAEKRKKKSENDEKEEDNSSSNSEDTDDEELYSEEVKRAFKSSISREEKESMTKEEAKGLSDLNLLARRSRLVKALPKYNSAEFLKKDVSNRIGEHGYRTIEALKELRKVRIMAPSKDMLKALPAAEEVLKNPKPWSYKAPSGSEYADRVITNTNAKGGNGIYSSINLVFEGQGIDLFSVSESTWYYFEVTVLKPA